jgi:hypothetical protein
LPAVPVLAAAAITFETHVWHHLSAPKTVPKALKGLVREMLLLADRITAVQVAVAALPTPSSSSSSTSSSSSSSTSRHRGDPTPQETQHQQHQDPQQQQQQQQQQQLGSSGDNAVSASVSYVVTMLTQPLHEAHLQQLALVAAVAAAVAAALLEPCPAAASALQHLVGQLQASREHSSELIATLRKQLHHDVMYVRVDDQQQQVLPGSQQQQQQQQQQVVQPSVGPGPPRASDASHLVRCLSVAMTSDGMLPVADPQAVADPHDVSSSSSSSSSSRGGGGGGNGGVAGGVLGGVGGVVGPDMAVHVSRWWWVHAGEHYCQLLAFQYAFDAAVAGFVGVAQTALELAEH